MSDKPKNIVLKIVPASPAKPERIPHPIAWRPVVNMPYVAFSPLVELVRILAAREAPATTAPPEQPRKVRAQAVAQYKLEVARAGRRLTNADIWTTARYRDESVFYRWLRGDVDSEAIDRVLREKPHLPQKSQ